MKNSKPFIISILLIIIGLNTKAQSSQYLFERKVGESTDLFIKRHLNEYSQYIDHKVIEGFWGDESKGKKIMAFYSENLVKEGYDRSTMIVFQPIGDGKNYIMLLFHHLGNTGVYHQGIISLFYYDVNKDGYKELVLLEKGENRAIITLEEINEEGEIVQIETTACCEETYNTIVIEQVNNKDNHFFPLLKEFEFDSEIDLSELKTAIEIKKAIIRYQKPHE